MYFGVKYDKDIDYMDDFYTARVKEMVQTLRDCGAIYGYITYGYGQLLDKSKHVYYAELSLTVSIKEAQDILTKEWVGLDFNSYRFAACINEFDNDITTMSYSKSCTCGADKAGTLNNPVPHFSWCDKA